MKKTPSEIYKTGQEIQLSIMKGAKGNFPISRTDEGIICLISRPANPKDKKYYPYNSKWNCEIKEIHDNKLIVSPLTMIQSAEEAEKELNDKLQLLATDKKQNRKTKEKVNYPYLPSNKVKEGGSK